jgi:hypothetical protein
MASVRFKAAARVPPGITAGQVMSELDAIEARFGRRSVDDCAKAVLAEPEQYPALRAFAPPDAETALREAVREAVLYATRIIVKDTGPGEPETRLLHVVHADDGAAIWADVPAIAASEPYQRELVRDLRKDAAAFARKMNDVLAELAAILGA